ncbi:MAG: IS630 family transposase [Bacteroidota bacterium]
MVRLTFTPQETERLRKERFQHPHPRVQVKMDVLLLKAHNLPHPKIAHIVGVSENTVRKYLQDYQQGGLERLQEVHFYKPQSLLVPHRETLAAYFEAHPPASVSEAVAKIEELTGIRRHLTQGRKFLKSLGLRRLKVGSIPAKADVEQQAQFKQQELEPRIEEARSGRRALYFVDAAHFVLAPFLGYLWVRVRRFIQAPSGRQRFNVLGALDALTHQMITVTNTTYINALSVCELLRQVAARHVGLPVTLILDNARYQKCALVQQLAATLDIELLYLPAYSPNLNLIERSWRFVKKKVLYCHYYKDFGSFQAAIADCVNQAHVTYREELYSLLTLRFQTFEKSQNVAA